MNRWEYTYLWWDGSVTSAANGHPVSTNPPIGDEVIDKLNSLGADGWEIDHIATAPLTTSWISPRGRRAAVGITDKVCYLAILRRTRAA